MMVLLDEDGAYTFRRVSHSRFSASSSVASFSVSLGKVYSAQEFRLLCVISVESLIRDPNVHIRRDGS